MKRRKLILLLFCVFLFTLGQAQVSKTVNITAGSLAGLFTPAENKTITNLKVTGTLNTSDFYFIRDSLSVIQILDLSEARIISPLDTIPDKAFYYKRTLQKISFPTNLVRIGYAAFYNCSGLLSVEVPATVTSMGASAFSSCGLKSVILPPTKISYYGWAFDNCDSLVTATTPYTNDGGNIFMGSNNLRTIIVPEGVTAIKASAFYQLSSMTNIKLPSTLTSIGNQAFYNCTALDSITIPEGVTSIEDGAFWECNKMKSVRLPKSLVTIKSTGFAHCRSLTSIEIPSTATAIESEAFRACTGLVTVTAASGTATYGGNIFSYCTNIKNIIIPEGTSSIKNNAFSSNFGSVTSIKIPVSVKSIGDQAFSGCSGIVSISIPDSVSSIGANAFSGCTGLKSVTIPNLVTKLGIYSFQNCSNLSSVTLPTSLTSIDEGVFSGCVKLPTVSFPNSLVSLGNSAFSGCTLLDLITIPSTVNSIGQSCFSGCISLKAIVIPSLVSTINTTVFSGCTGLTSVQFPSSLTSIAYQAFLGCNALTSITIPANTTISYNAFQNCKGLVQATTPYAYNSGNIFAGCDNLKTILIPSGTASICSNGFYNCSTLDSISIPSSVQTIGNYAFYGCSSLKKFNLPKNLLTIGDYGLANCSSLTSISLPATISAINSNAFQGCTGLTSISVNNSFPIDLTQSTSVFNNVNKTICQLNVPYGTKLRYSATNQWSDFANMVEKSTGIFVSSNKVELSANPGSTITVDVKANVASWTANSNQTWLTVSPASGTSDNILTFTTDNTQITTVRNAVVTVSAPGFISQTVVVYQKLAPKTISISAGGLSAALTANELSSLSTLIVTGTMDARDFKTMRDSMPQLTDLDLTGVSIAAYTGVNGTYPNSITYPANVFPIYAFYNGTTAIGKTTLKTVKLPSTITSIGSNAFGGCSGLTTTISIPSSVVSISSNAFYNCTGLSSITIPTSVSTIGSYAFYNCTGLTSIIVNSSYPIDITSPTYVFYNINKTACLLYVPYGSKSLYAALTQWKDFANIVENATGFILSTNKLKLPYNTGSSVNVDLKSNVAWTVSSDQPWLTVNPGSGSGNYTLVVTAKTNTTSTTRKAIITVSAPNCISQIVEVTQNIAPKAIDITAGGLSTVLTTEELSSLSSLTLTGTMDARDFKTLRDKMPLLTNLDFTGTSILAYTGTDGTYPSSTSTIYPANTIPQYAFYGKTILKSVVIPSTVTAIGNYVFQSCSSLTSFIIPSTVNSIGAYTFYGCTSLTSIYSNSSYPIDLSNSYSVFYNVNKTTCTLNVPYKAKTLYAAAYQWSDFNQIIESTQGFMTGTDKVKIAYMKESTGTVDVVANVGWTVTSDQPWLTVSPGSGSGDSKLTFTADKNDSTARRYAKVIVTSPVYGSQIITVTQTGSPKTINIIAGSLSTSLTAEELSSIADLNITGTMDARDFRTLRDKMPELARLDISKVTIAPFNGTGGTYDFSAGYSANAVPPSAFYTYSPEWSKTSLISIKLPSTLKSIGSSAFQSCTGLTSVYINSAYPIDFTTSGDPFSKTNKAGCTLYVPYATKPYYSAAAVWKDFMNIVENAQGFLVSQRAIKFTASTISKSISIAVKSNVAWTTQSNQPWLVTSSNDSIITLTAEANPADTIREATVTVSSPGFDSQFVLVTQAAAPRKVTAGGLSSVLTSTELSTVTDLALMGTVDARDFKTMRDNMPALANIDLSAVNVSAYEGPNCDLWGDSSIKKYPANEIPRQAFYMSKKIKSMIMPQTVTSVGEYAFGYTSLSSVLFAKSIRSIGIYAFSVCTDLNSVTLPDSLISIGDEAFSGSGLSGQLYFPSTLKKIGASAFYYCSGLTGLLTIPASVDSIGGSSFNNCYGLSSLVINSIDPIIGTNAFSSCSGLKSITLPTTLTTIGEGAFGYCVNLKSITLPPSLKLIGSKAFQVCMGITSIDFPASLTTIGDYTFTNSGLINLTIPSTLTNIGTYAFSSCANLNSVSFPSTLKKISNGLFYNCKNLNSITFPSGLEAIGNDVFNNCTALTNIELPISLTKIGDYAFQYCTGLNYINLPINLTSIGSCSFSSCTGLTGIVIPNLVSSVGSSAFSNCTGLQNITFGNSLIGIADYTFNSCSALINITIPNTIKSIGDDAFNSCTGLTTITIPNSVTSIGNEAFKYCNSLNKVIIPNSITSIKSGTFSNCTGLKNIDIPNSIQTIGNSAFSHCTSLNNLTIPNSVNYITDAAFEYCSSLTSVIIPNLITTLKYNTFSHCTKLSSVTIPNSLKTTEASVFEYCTALTNINLPESLTNIGHYFFSNCTALSSIIIPNSVTVINTGAFEYCSSLKSVTIGNSVKSIEDGVFKNCNSLPSISIPASVTSLGSASFSCSGLNSIYVYSQTPIQVYSWISVFENVNKSICMLYVPVGSKSLYKSAYLWQDFVNIIESATAVPALNAEKICIYLNPVSESLSIHGIEGTSTISIYDLNGRALLCKQVQLDENISISNFPTGLYIVRIITNEGRIEKKVLKN